MLALLPVPESVEPVTEPLAIPVVVSDAVSVVFVDEFVGESVPGFVIESVELDVLDVSVVPVVSVVVEAGVGVVVVVGVVELAEVSVCWGCCVWVQESAWAAAAASSVDETITAKVFLRMSGPSGDGSFTDPGASTVFDTATVWDWRHRLASAGRIA